MGDRLGHVETKSYHSANQLLGDGVHTYTY
jgi:hypothetical protein